METRNTKATVREAYEEEAGFLSAEQLELRSRLEKAVAEYDQDESEEHFKALCLAFIHAVKGKVSGFSPFTDNDRAAYCEDGDGSWYVICTSPEEAELCPENRILLFNMDDVVKITVCDRRHDGLCLNPYGGHPCHLRREGLWELRMAAEREQV